MQRRLRLERHAARRFGELTAVGFDQRGHVRIGGRGQPELLLEIDLRRRVIEQIGATNYVGHALIGVIDHDRKQVGEPSVAALEDEVAGGERDVLPKGPLYTVGELHVPGVDSYGYCLETGEEIGIKRLEARPVATLSVEAQERRERREKQYGDRDDRYR